jgi:hypothetical protein
MKYRAERNDQRMTKGWKRTSVLSMLRKESTTGDRIGMSAPREANIIIKTYTKATDQMATKTNGLSS